MKNYRHKIEEYEKLLHFERFYFNEHVCRFYMKVCILIIKLEIKCSSSWMPGLIKNLTSDTAPHVSLCSLVGRACD